MSITPDQLLMEELSRSFQPDKAGTTNAVIQFDLGGDPGGQYHLEIAGSSMTPHRGRAENPNLTLTLDGQDCVRIFTGQMDPTAAFMSGKLKVKGDMGLALKLQ